MKRPPTPPGIDPDDPNYVENPVTGERFLFHTRPNDANTDPLVFDIWAPPGMVALEEHIHPNQVETFMVHRGKVELTRDDATEEVGEGAQITIPAGTPHTWRTSGDEELHLTIQLQPGRYFEDFARDLAALAQRGKVKDDGSPSILQIAVMSQEYPDEIYLAQPPIWVQKTLFRILNPIARWMGYQANPVQGRVD